MKNVCFAILALLLVTAVSYSQTDVGTKQLPPQGESYYSLNSDAQHPLLTQTQPARPEVNAVKKELLRRLNQARLANDIALKAELEAALDKMEGSTTVPMEPVNGIQWVPGSQQSGNGPLSKITGTSTITTQANWAFATGVDHSTGRLFTAVAVYGYASTDILDIYYSDDGGQSWGTLLSWWYTNDTVHFRPGEFDLEVVRDTSDTWLFGVIGATDVSHGNTKFSLLFRYNVTKAGLFLSRLSWPGMGGSSDYVYNPRITSDNSVYTEATYIYLVASYDSTLGGGYDYLTLKYAIMENPFDSSPTITYKSPGPDKRGFYWHTGSVPSGTYLSGDIAYHNDNDTNRIMTVYNYMPNTNLYLAWSDDYGSTVTGSLLLSGTALLTKARIAFDGGLNNQNGMIVALEQYSSSDWDTKFFNTTTSGRTPASWVSGYVDASTGMSRSCDVVGIQGSNNLFRAATAVDSNAIYAGFGGTSWNSPSRTKLNSGARVDTLFGTVRAGYKLGGGDDGFAAWATGNGVGVYSSFNFMTAVASGPPAIPTQVHLLQNYPNPFNPTTMITYELSRSSQVTLEVYNTIGQLVATLVNEVRPAGEHSIRFHGENLASGVYYYRLKAGTFVETKKLLLIR